MGVDVGPTFTWQLPPVRVLAPGEGARCGGMRASRACIEEQGGLPGRPLAAKPYWGNDYIYIS